MVLMFVIYIYMCVFIHIYVCVYFLSYICKKIGAQTEGIVVS